MVIIRALLYLIVAFIVALLLIALVSAGIVFGKYSEACTDMQSLPEMATSTVPHLKEVEAIPNYMRDEQVTFLTFPEWYIVYSAREYSTYLNASGTPSTFPYNTATAQFWCSYMTLKKYTDVHYAKDTWWHVALVTIGSSFSAENLIQEVYENTIGNLSLVGGGADTPEDQVEREVASDYAQFLDTIPWYRYPFFDARAKLWRQPFFGEHMGRRWERQIALTTGYSVKGGYGWLMGKAVNDTGVYAPADLTILLQVRLPLSVKLANDERIKIIKNFGDGTGVVEVPRYQAFTELMKEFAAANVKILDIAGNSKILVSLIVESDWKYDLPGNQYFAMPIAIDTSKKRVIAVIPNALLMESIRQMSGEKIILEHIYDY